MKFLLFILVDVFIVARWSNFPVEAGPEQCLCPSAQWGHGREPNSHHLSKSLPKAKSRPPLAAMVASTGLDPTTLQTSMNWYESALRQVFEMLMIWGLFGFVVLELQNKWKCGEAQMYISNKVLIFFFAGTAELPNRSQQAETWGREVWGDR